MNMGVVARLLHDRFVAAGSSGTFRVAYSPAPEEAVRQHAEMSSRYPLKTENGRVVSGYLPLVPVGKASRYRAFMLVASE